MKIVSVLTSGSRGGAEYAAVGLLDALAAAGHETVLVSDHPGLVAGARVREDAVELGPKLAGSTALRLTATAPLLLARLRRALERHAPYDVLLLHFKKEQLLGAALPKRLRPRLVWAEWGRLPTAMRSGPPNRLYRLAARPVEAVLCVSETTRQSIVAAGVDAARVHVVPNVIAAGEARPDPEGGRAYRNELGIPADAFVLGLSARFHHSKRNDVAVEAAKRLAAEAPLHLVLAGDGPDEAALRARAAPLGDAAHFVPMPVGRMSAFLSACDVVVFCPAASEGAPRSIITAMLAARPCVATGSEGAAGLLVPGAGAIVSPDHDPDAAAAVLREYRDDPERRRREGEAARRRVAGVHEPQAVAALVERLLASR